MGEYFYSKNENKLSKLETAKMVLNSMLNHIGPQDYYSLVLFDDVADVIYPLTVFSEIDKEILNLKISNIKTRGGTNFSKGFKAAYDLLHKEPREVEYEKRIFFITDAMPN